MRRAQPRTAWVLLQRMGIHLSRCSPDRGGSRSAAGPRRRPVASDPFRRLGSQFLDGPNDACELLLAVAELGTHDGKRRLIHLASLQGCNVTRMKRYKYPMMARIDCARCS